MYYIIIYIVNTYGLYEIFWNFIKTLDCHERKYVLVKSYNIYRDYKIVNESV